MGEKRDIQRIMEREIRKGSCPLQFERMEFQKDAYRPVLSEQDLEEAFDYLLRLGKFRWYEEKTVINNIYMNYDVIRGNITMKRAKTYLERLELKNRNQIIVEAWYIQKQQSAILNSMKRNWKGINSVIRESRQ